MQYGALEEDPFLRLASEEVRCEREQNQLQTVDMIFIDFDPALVFQ